MRYGSVCSGIEAATAAWHGLGWKPAWFAKMDEAAATELAFAQMDKINEMFGGE